MVDARFPERLLVDRRLQQLSPVDFQSYFQATLWSVSNRTDGCVLQEELPMIPKFSARSVERLLEVGLWERLGIGYLMVDFEADQTSKSDLEVLENARRREREKKARQRAEKRVPRDTESSPSFKESMSPGTGAGTTQDRQAGIDAEEERRYTTWPTAVPGTGRKAS